MTLPIASEINVHDSLDERKACEHFLGKDVEGAESLFRDNSLYYQEDLMFMGPVAFRYYVPAFIRYIRSDCSEGDSDSINCLHGLIRFWMGYRRADITPVVDELMSACRYIVSNYEKFAVAPLYGNLRKAFEKLLSDLSQPHAE